MKDFTDRIKDERLTDNTQIPYCRQCTVCRHWGNDASNYWQNKPNKDYCDKYPYPTPKPNGVIDGTQVCPYREYRDGIHDR